MIPLLEKLRALMELNSMSPGEISRYVGCSQATVYNWLIYQSSTPGRIYQDRIKKAIRKIRNVHGDSPEEAEVLQIWMILQPKLKLKETMELLRLVQQSGGLYRPEFQEKLKALAVKHHIQVKEAAKAKGSR